MKDEQAASPSSRQTLSYLRTLFQERGIRPKNKMGQNFLIDLNLLDLLLRSAELTRADLALEVGSGTGSLTVRLAGQAGAVLSVELDPAFAALTDEAVSTHLARFPLPGAGPWQERVNLLHADVLKNKNELNPEVLAALTALAGRAGTTRVKLVANLPYAVAVPVVTNLLLSAVGVERMVVTVQWEIAERFLAAPGTKDFGALAVLVQSLAEVQLLRRLPPAVFWPRPKVDSAIVLLRPDPARFAHVRATVGDPLRLRNFLRDLYAHRRKNLRGALVALPGDRFGKPEVDARLAELGVEGTTRAEALDREQHLRLCAVFG
jgi:16S rRNA (adenine1518-N6/adenine1519-N6)-dimethyltransferase